MAGGLTPMGGGVVRVDPEAADPTAGADAVAAAVRHLEAGGCLGYPTETVYGLGARADAAGVDTVRALKGRDEGHPMLVLVPEPDELREGPDRWGLVWTEAAVRLARAHWPGPLTLVLPDPGGSFPPGIRSKSGGVAVRGPAHPWVRALLKRWDRPLISTSANRSGAAPARSADEVLRAVEGAPGADGVLVVDAGFLPPSAPSTVVDLTGEALRVVREGAIPADALWIRASGREGGEHGEP